MTENHALCEECGKLEKDNEKSWDEPPNRMVNVPYPWSYDIRGADNLIAIFEVYRCKICNEYWSMLYDGQKDLEYKSIWWNHGKTQDHIGLRFSFVLDDGDLERYGMPHEMVEQGFREALEGGRRRGRTHQDP